MTASGIERAGARRRALVVLALVIGLLVSGFFSFSSLSSSLSSSQTDGATRGPGAVSPRDPDHGPGDTSHARHDAGVEVAASSEPSAPASVRDRRAPTAEHRGHDAGRPASPSIAIAPGEAARTVPDRSPPSEEPAELTIENGCAEPLELVWLDFDGRERSYGTLARGAIATQPTYAQHVWVLRAAESHRVVRTLAAGAEGYVEACPEGDALRDPHPPAPDPAAPRLCSHGGDQAVSLAVTNACEGPLTLHWVDFSCALRPYGMLAPGESRVQETFAGHVWRALGPDGTVHAQHVASLERAQLVVRCGR